MAKYYAVREGSKTGIFKDWNKVLPLVSGYPGAVYKRFNNKADAVKFMNQGKEYSALYDDTITAIVFYQKESNVENSYCIIDYHIDGEKKYEENVTINYNRSIKYEHDIEFLAVVRAMQRAIDLGYQTMNIVYNYPGVVDYLTGYWTAREDTAQEYIRRFQILNTKIDVGFTRNIEDVPVGRG